MQKNFVTVGIARKQSTLIRAKIVIIFIAFGMAIVLQTINLSQARANHFTFQQYMESIYMASIAVISFLAYANIVFKRETVFELIDRTEDDMRLCKSNAFI